MRALARRRLYGREAMLRALLGAGQFAHKSEGFLDDCLDEVFDELAPEVLDRDWERRVSQLGYVPPHLVHARFRERDFEPEYYGTFINYVAVRFGVCCCLCRAVETPTWPNDDFEPPIGFWRMLAPAWATYASIEDGCHYYGHLPVCHRCLSLISRSGIPALCAHSDNPDDWPIGMAPLLRSAGFRRRVETNAKRWLRVDPRTAAPLVERSAA